MITIEGVVVSISGEETVKIVVKQRVSDPKYKKRYTKTDNFLAHNPQNKAKIGDEVVITQVKPISKKKHFIVSEIKPAK